LTPDRVFIYPLNAIEWRNFASNDDGAKDSSRVGASSDPLLEGELDSTIISKMDGGSGASFNLSKTQVKVVGKAQKNLLNAFKQIDLMCDGIGLSRIVKDSAKQFFKKVILLVIF
jgi:transcription initiation factor TFIIB